MGPEILKIVADNPALFQALKELFEAEFNLDEIATTMTNEGMGQVVRARIEGLKKIEKAFKKIEAHRSFTPKPVTKNPAR